MREVGAGLVDALVQFHQRVRDREVERVLYRVVANDLTMPFFCTSSTLSLKSNTLAIRCAVDAPLNEALSPS